MNHCLYPRFRCYEVLEPQCLVLFCIHFGTGLRQCGLYHAVFRETREQPLKRSLSNLVVDFSGSFLLQDRMTVHSETFADESKFCLRVLTQLDTFVHSSNDVRLCQALVLDELSKSHGDSECDASSGYCGDHVLHVLIFPLRRCCTRVVHVVIDFRFQRGSFIGVVEFMQVRRHQDRVTHDVTIIHVPLIRQASIFLQRVPRVVGSGELSRTT